MKYIDLETETVFTGLVLTHDCVSLGVHVSISSAVATIVVVYRNIATRDRVLPTTGPEGPLLCAKGSLVRRGRSLNTNFAAVRSLQLCGLTRPPCSRSGGGGGG